MAESSKWVNPNHTPRWFHVSLLKHNFTQNAWFLTALLRDDELQGLPEDEYVAEFSAAMAGTENRFSKYISFTDPTGNV